MGLFSKLFGSDGKDIDDALGKMKNLAEDIIDDGQINSQQNKPSTPVEGAQSLNAQRYEPSDEPDGPSGDSWGPKMPDEPNQYNSGLSYQDYFSQVFAEAFPSYQIRKEPLKSGNGTVFTFYQGGSKKMVVEVLSTSASVYKLREDCRKQQIPYRRFYYNYDGWWNTRSYVIRRVKEAMGI